jgi:hypothetical protein
MGVADAAAAHSRWLTKHMAWAGWWKSCMGARGGQYSLLGYLLGCIVGNLVIRESVQEFSVGLVQDKVVMGVLLLAWVPSM